MKMAVTSTSKASEPPLYCTVIGCWKGGGIIIMDGDPMYVKDLDIYYQQNLFLAIVTLNELVVN